VARFLAALLLAPLVAWGAAALWVDGPAPRPLAGGLALGFAAASLALLWRIRSVLLAGAAVLLGFAALCAWWFSIAPRNDRDWQRDVARPARASSAGRRVSLENVRNFAYRSETDYDERWETRTIDLDRITGVDLYLSHWGSPHIAHTIASWQFEGDRPLAISIETRKEVGESYSALLGFFRRYEIYYVVADERDVVLLRTNMRNEDVYRYPIRLDAARARALLVDYLEEVNRLDQRAEWYNALTDNCTTAIRRHVQRALGHTPFSWKILANGHYPELLYERAAIDTSRPFAEVRARAAVSARAKAIGDVQDFSAWIREDAAP
jgi:Domain of unknown function (DUF4105)